MSANVGTKCYKLTTQENKTMEMFWPVAAWQLRSGVGDLCSAAFLHAYPTALTAAFMNPVHANIQLPKLWVAEALGSFKEDAGLKMGFAQLRVVQEIFMPVLSQEARIKAALLCSLEVCGNPIWTEYARNYIEGPRLKIRMAANFVESEEERTIRTYAYKASQYEEVERNAAIAIQAAAQYRSIDVEAIFTEAYGGTFLDTPTKGRSVEGQAFRSAPL